MVLVKDMSSLGHAMLDAVVVSTPRNAIREVQSVNNKSGSPHIRALTSDERPLPICLSGAVLHKLPQPITRWIMRVIG